MPLIVFTAYQVSTLNENEKVLTEIYDNQLEAILFSVNQYSQDLVDAWSRDINLALLDSTAAEEKLNLFLEENESVRYIVWTDTLLSKTKLWSLTETSNAQVEQLVLDSLSTRKDQITRLANFQRGGYTKKEPLGFLDQGQKQYLEWFNISFRSSKS